MRVKNLFPPLLFINQFDIVDKKTGEVYFSKSFNSSQAYVSEKKLGRMTVVRVVSEDNGRFTIWVQYYKG